MRCFPKILFALSVLLVSSRAQTDSDAEGSIDAQGEIVLQDEAEKPATRTDNSDQTDSDSDDEANELAQDSVEPPEEESRDDTKPQEDEAIVVEEVEGLILGGEEEEDILIIEEGQLEEIVPGTSAESNEREGAQGSDETESAERDEEEWDERDEERGRFYEEENEYADEDDFYDEEEDAVETEDDEPEKPAIVEDPRSINVAKNLEEYRSPRAAMLLSLLMPGLGQAYARNYWKTAAFGIVEAALIGTAIGFSLEGKKYEEQAFDHAQKHYKPEKFYEFYDRFRSYLQKQGEFKDMPIDSVMATYYWDNAETFVDTDTTNETISRKTRNFNVKENPPKGFENIVEADGYVQGWEDAEPYMTEGDGWTLDSSAYGSKWFLNGDNYLVYKEGQDSSDYNFGHSELLARYRDIKDEARGQYQVRNIMIYSLLANHVVSAVDALITARAHNNRLLGKQSFLDRVNLDYDIAMTDTDITSYYWVRVRF